MQQVKSKFENVQIYVLIKIHTNTYLLNEMKMI